MCGGGEGETEEMDVVGSDGGCVAGRVDAEVLVVPEIAEGG